MDQTITTIVLDVDGTLLNSQHQLSERNAQTIRAAVERGLTVILATGKTRASTQAIIDRLGLHTPGIYLQGLAIYNADGTLRHEQTLAPDVARQAITYAEDRGYTVIAYSGSNILMKSVNDVGRQFSSSYHEPEPEGIGPLQNILGEMPVHKLMAIKSGDPRAIKALRWQLSMQLDDKAKLVQASIPDMLEIVPPGSSKGAALKTLLREEDIDPAAVMAVGDGENDIEMLQLVGIGVAVENAAPELKAVADHTTGSNDADGVAQAIERFVTGAASDEPAGDAAGTEAAADSGASDS